MFCMRFFFHRLQTQQKITNQKLKQQITMRHCKYNFSDDVRNMRIINLNMKLKNVSFRQNMFSPKVKAALKVNVLSVTGPNCSLTFFGVQISSNHNIFQLEYNYTSN